MPKASFAATVKVKAVPAVWVNDEGETEKEAAVAAEIVTLGLVPVARLGEPLDQVAVTDCPPAVLNVTPNDATPPDSAAGEPAIVAAGSEAATATVGFAVETGFQLGSTARTVITTDVPAAWPVGEPVKPLAVPGAATWPGRSTWSLVAAPASTVTSGLVPVDRPGEPATYAADTVQEPAVRKVSENVLVPPTRTAPEGGTAFASVVAMVTDWVEAATRFQYWSTALTVTEDDVPAVRLPGDPLYPPLVPGAGVIPGSRTWSMIAEPGTSVRVAVPETGVPGLYVAVIVSVSAVFDAVIVIEQIPLVPVMQVAVVEPLRATSPLRDHVTVAPTSGARVTSLTVAVAVDVVVKSAMMVVGESDTDTVAPVGACSVIVLLVPVMEPVAWSVAVMVLAPVVTNVAPNVRVPVPATSVEPTGRVPPPPVLEKSIVPAKVVSVLP